MAQTEADSSFFCCPVCGGELIKTENSLRCRAGHCYDLAKKGYVNLLMSQQSGLKRHGDDALMARARSAFLDKGYYAPLRDALAQELSERVSSGGRILDAGCGECYYTCVASDIAGTSVGGIDISREALAQGAKRRCGAELAVAGVSRLPVASGSCEAMINFFAPIDAAEFGRVLREKGLLLRAVPLERHLFGLKAAVYEHPYENDPPREAIEGFRLLKRRDIRYVLRLDGAADLEALFRMTPYYYKTGEEDQQRFAELTELETEIGFALLLYENAH